MSKNGGPNTLWQAQQPQQQGTLPNHPLANYTLPGVINYLTSEFTNLERFKIMANLEKQEMKYKVVQLQSELNTLKFVNDKQETRIRELEAENAHLRLKDEKPASAKQVAPETIPEIDLLVIKKSRYQLTKSMREVIQLLKTPSATNSNFANLPDPSQPLAYNEYDELFSKDDFVFDSNLRRSSQSKNEKRAKPPVLSVFLGYLSDDNKEKEYIKEATDIVARGGSPDAKEEIIPDSSLDPLVESDAETVIEELPELSNTVSDDTEVNKITFDSVDVSRLSPEAKDLTINTPTPITHRVLHENGFIVSATAADNSTEVRLKTDSFDFLGLLPTLLEDLVGIYPFRTGTATQILAISRAGADLHTFNDGKKSHQSLIGATEISGFLTRSAIVEFTTKTKGAGRSYGLLVAGISTENKPYIRVFAIGLRQIADSTVRELALFNSGFFKTTGDIHSIHWYSAKSGNLSPPKHSKSPQKRLQPASDAALALYEIIVHVGSVVVRTNIASKAKLVVQEDVDTSISVCDSYILYARDSKLVLYEFEKDSVVEKEADAEGAVYILVKAVGEYYPLVLKDQKLAAYNTALNEIQSQALEHEDGTVLTQVGREIVVCDGEKGHSAENIYSISSVVGV